METIKLTIDNKEVEVAKGTTILRAASEYGIEIPILCYFSIDGMNIENKPAGCRVCVVEVEGFRNLVPACATDCENGMVIHTHSMRVLHARRTVVGLILSDHPAECLVCQKAGNCELQTLAERLGIRKVFYQGEQSTYRKDMSPSIVRDIDKCVVCRRCEMMCNDLQSVGALSAAYRGFPSVVTPAFQMDLEKSPCTYCGQCVTVCPTGALTENDETGKVIRMLSDPTKTVIVQTAPAVRVALGEEFGMELGTSVTGKMVAALRRLGFNAVFDTDFAADLTIMEEGAELLERLDKFLKGDSSVKLPILTSCCPGWVNFFEMYFPDLLDVPSTAKSPQQMFGAIAKTYYADKIGVKREDMIVVSIMPCLAKKYEAQRDEFKVNGNPDVDIVLSTRELAALVKQSNIDFRSLPDEDFDKPLGESTGAGVIFGVTGGVIEAATRTAYEKFTGKTLEKVEFEAIRGLDGTRSAEVDFNGTKIRIGIAHGLSNARKLLEEVRCGKSQFHAIEVMACPGGCIGGGGQPYTYRNHIEILRKRAAALYQEDAGKKLRKSHENPYIKKLYEEFLGEPGGKKAHELLHTGYFDKSEKEIVVPDMKN
ncbi:MAG: NADH-dependent [FeFe] hydrogenase, group A6 [Bacteroidales bacterium]|nr:NADH-dependent [FeFe] hydrogenase, group A6 [Bacteroidales bacterium]